MIRPDEIKLILNVFLRSMLMMEQLVWRSFIRMVKP